MAKLTKRGSIWHYDFRFQRQRFQGSTFLKNKEKAESFVAKFRSDLALGLVGLTHRDPPPILSVFLKGAFLDSVKQNAKKPRTLEFYECRIRSLCQYPPFTQLRLDRIDELAVQGYKDARLAKRLAIASINAELRTLRKAMIFADTCGLIRYKRIRALPGEKGREYILDGETETRYLALADYPLRQVAILMLDLGLRPEEAVGLRKVDIADDAVAVIEGKTVNARRSVPQTERTRAVLELCSSLFPDSEWVFPGNKGKHLTRGAVTDRHAELRQEHGFPVQFVLYSLRHTFASRLAEACGGDTFVLKEALGHASTRTTEKYVHLTGRRLTLAMRQKELLDKAMRGEVKHEPSSSIGRTSDDTDGIVERNR